MKTSFGLALAALLAATVGAVYTGLPAAATQPPPLPPSLPPVVLDPGVKLPPLAPAEMKPPAPPPLPVPKADLPPLPTPTPLPLPTVPPPVKSAPLPIPLPAATAEPVKLPPLPPPPTAAPAPAKLPVVPPPLPPPTFTPPAPLPAVPPPSAALPKAAPLPAPRAEAPQSLPPPTPVTTASPPAIGSVAVMQDGKVVEGHVSRTGDKIVVRRGVVDQPFPAEQVKYVAKDKDDAYRLSLKDTKADDPAARLRLARWCMYNGMRENALTEAREAVRLEPANRTAAELARTLDESLRLYPGDGTTRVAPPAPPAPGLPAVPPPPAPVVSVPEPDIAPEAVVAFGPRVQPVLMNQCATCHAKEDYAGAFKLVAVASNETNPAATRQNLRAAAGQIKKSEPGASPLLAKAQAAHGGMLAPAFADRDALPYRILQAWAYLAVGDLTPPVAAAPLPTPAPTLPPPPRVDEPAADVRPMLPPPPPPMPLPAPPEARPLPPPIPPAADTLPTIPPIPPAMSRLPALPPVTPVTPAGGFGQSAPPPAAPTGPARDEFDPSKFNRTPARR